MSGAAEGIVGFHGIPAALGTAGGGVSPYAAAFGQAAVTTGGLVVAGAAMYLAARRLQSDYLVAVADFEARHQLQLAAWNAGNASAALLQVQGQQMALSLTEVAREDPNTAFVLAGARRLMELAGGSGPGGPNAGEALRLASAGQELAEFVAQSGGQAGYARYEELRREVAELVARQRVEQSAAPEQPKTALARAILLEEVAALRADVEAFYLGAQIPSKAATLAAAQAQGQLSEVETLAIEQPAMARQSLGILRDRLRVEMRQASKTAAAQQKQRQRVRELTAQITARAQTLIGLHELPAAHEQGQGLLKALALQVGASPVELRALEELAAHAETMFLDAERQLDEAAMQIYLEDQVAGVLNNLGYRVTRATGSAESQAAHGAEMVAVVNSEVGMRLRVQGDGSVGGEMVALTPGATVVDAEQEEHVCQLMDQIWDGLRQRNLVVKEKKRKRLAGAGKPLEVVREIKSAVAPEAAVVAPLALEVPVGS